MPKKRAPLQYTKPAGPVHPSLSPSSSVNKNGLRSLNPSDPSAEKSVNQLIQDLRINQAPPAPIERPQRPLNPQTVHPSLRSILQVPETPPLRPRPGMRAARGPHGRGPAGPPPPISWLYDSMHAPAHMRQKKQGLHDTQAPCERVEQLGGLPDQYFPGVDSLAHQALKALAKGWDWHVQYDQFYLATLPTRYKQALLSYIAFYKPESITLHSLDVLFLDDSQLQDATGSEGLTHLDLATSIGRPLGLKELKDFFTKKRVSVNDDITTTKNEVVPDSWEIPSIAPSPTVSRFPFLSHLSLARPSTGSWRSLLALAPRLLTLTHLSLAYWPIPSLTPNSKTAYRTTPRGDVDYGASNFYSLYDCDFSEAAGVLRRLSRSLLCLKWLDLTGCTVWVRALGAESGIEWNGAWRGVETVKVGYGAIPESVIDGSGRWRELWMDIGLEYWSSEKLAMKRELRAWVEFEKNLKAVEEEVAYMIAQPVRGTMGGGDTVAEEAPTSLPGTWWDYGHNSRLVDSKLSPRSCRVKFERGWESWWIEDAVREMTPSHPRIFQRRGPR